MNGTHQCDFLNFCGGFGSQLIIETHDASAPGVVGPYGENGIQHASQLACMYMLEEARKLTSSREILLWMTPSEAPKALQASECSELLDPMRASCWISAQH